MSAGKTYVFRGIDAPASLKRLCLWSECSTSGPGVFRGIDAPASLKLIQHGNFCPVELVVILDIGRDGSVFRNGFTRERAKINKARVGELIYAQEI